MSKVSRILIIDDDKELLCTFRDLLAAKGFIVSTAEESETALKMLLRDEFDAVLCDFMMPTMSGDALYWELKKQRPEICSRFIFVTGFKKEPRFARFIEREQVRVLTKPVTSAHLVKTLKEVDLEG